MKLELIGAKFITEKKGRFLCEIEINGNIEIAHIPNSAKLSKYIDIKDRSIIVVKNKSKNAKTMYQLVAVKSKEKWILLNLNILNQMVEEYYLSNGNGVEKEKKIYDSYRADLIIHSEKNIVCEVKGVLSEMGRTLFPRYAGIRATKQMLNLKRILKNKMFEEVYYILVIMNPDTNEIIFDKGEEEYYRLLKQCIKLGMKIIMFDIIFENDELRVIESNKIIKI